MRILSVEERHETHSSAYDKLLNSNRSINTRSAKRGEPTFISASSQTFHNSFLPRSIRDLRIPPHNTNSAYLCAKTLYVIIKISKLSYMLE